MNKQKLITGQLAKVLARMLETYAAGEYPSGTEGCLEYWWDDAGEMWYCHRDMHEGDPYHISFAYSKRLRPQYVWVDLDEKETDSTPTGSQWFCLGCGVFVNKGEMCACGDHEADPR